MLTMSARAFGALSLLFCLVCLASNTARADVVWNPETGWRIEGGVLEGLGGRDGQDALALMNRARTPGTGSKLSSNA